MSTEDKRDLNADLALCRATTAGPWQSIYGDCCDPFVESTSNGEGIADVYSDADARFISEARTGWPHAIKRAMAAERWREEALKASLRANTAEQRAHELEAEVKRLRGALERMDDRENPMIPRSEMARIAKETLDSEVSANV